MKIVQKTPYLDELLKKAGHYHPHYGDRLAAHLPMVLIALDKLGASNEKLDSYFEASVQGLEPIDSIELADNITAIDQHLGNSDKYLAYLKYFRKQISTYGCNPVIKNSLPDLLPGIAASAFHALIRLAYAIEANNADEIAVSLAYWCAEFQSFDLANKYTNDPLEVILSNCAPIGTNHTFLPGIIVDRMNEIGTLLKTANKPVIPSVLNITDLKELCIRAFYFKNDFTLLHTVTGCHAFSVVAPYSDNTEEALSEFWKAILIAYLSTGLVFDNKAIGNLPATGDFLAVISKALQSNDSHVIKLVYSCFQEYTANKNPMYYFVAERALDNDCPN